MLDNFVHSEKPSMHVNILFGLSFCFRRFFVYVLVCCLSTAVLQTFTTFCYLYGTVVKMVHYFDSILIYLSIIFKVLSNFNEL